MVLGTKQEVRSRNYHKLTHREFPFCENKQSLSPYEDDQALEQVVHRGLGAFFLAHTKNPSGYGPKQPILAGVSLRDVIGLHNLQRCLPAFNCSAISINSVTLIHFLASDTAQISLSFLLPIFPALCVSLSWKVH